MADTQVNMNANTTTGLSAEMKTYYSDYLIDNAIPNLVHDQFGQKHPIPANGGKTINFRRFVPFSKATEPLSEGITPDGGSLSVTSVSAEVSQYGYYVTLSDMLTLTSVDNTLVETTKLLGSQAGTTLDTITREVLNGGTNVIYASGRPARETLGKPHKLTVDDVYKAARFLKAQNAPKIEGGYVAIIHPDVAYDLMRDDEWIDVNKYALSENIFEGEIGKIAGVRFVESTEAKIFKPMPFLKHQKMATCESYTSEATDTVADKGVVSPHRIVIGNLKVQEDIVNLVGTVISIREFSETGDFAFSYSIDVCGANIEKRCIYLDPVQAAEYSEYLPRCVYMYPYGAGDEGRTVYSTLIMGANAYGVTEVTGGGLQHIVKQLGSGGTADPLNQRSTAGWKGTKVAELLVDNYIVRVESASTFESDGN